MLSTGVMAVSLVAVPAEAAPGSSEISATLSATVSQPGGIVAVSGRIEYEGTQKRTVVLEQKIASGWRKVDRTRSSRTGDYSLTVPTTWFYSSKLRTRVVKNRQFRGATSRSRRMGVVPAYAPLGSPTSWAPLSRHGDRFDPCRTITYGINTARATPDATIVSARIQDTIALVAQATGMRFRFVGATSAMPFDRSARRTDPRLVFGFTTDAQTRLDLGAGVAARGGSDRTRWARDARGRRVLETLHGGVLYDLTDTASMTAAQFQQLTLHEVGHVMGLGHVVPTDQYMSAGPEFYRLPLSYQAGDLTGLSRIGLQAGCLRPVRSRGRSIAGRLPVPVATILD